MLFLNHCLQQAYFYVLAIACNTEEQSSLDLYNIAEHKVKMPGYAQGHGCCQTHLLHMKCLC